MCLDAHVYTCIIIIGFILIDFSFHGPALQNHCAPASPMSRKERRFSALLTDYSLKVQTLLSSTEMKYALDF